ncbi:MAG: hypothetical protein R3B09_29485 [Nannocystaceae bacterium]
MPSWIFFLHLLFPSVQAGPADLGVAAELDDEAEVVLLDDESEGMRYRGVELLFAKFDAEAALVGE